MVVPVLMMSCHVSEKPKMGPVTAHARTMAQAPANAMGEPAKFEVCFAMSAKLRLVFCSCCMAF